MQREETERLNNGKNEKMRATEKGSKEERQQKKKCEVEKRKVALSDQHRETLTTTKLPGPDALPWTAGEEDKHMFTKADTSNPPPYPGQGRNICRYTATSQKPENKSPGSPPSPFPLCSYVNVPVQINPKSLHTRPATATPR